MKPYVIKKKNKQKKLSYLTGYLKNKKPFTEKLLHSFANEKFNKKIEDDTSGRIKSAVIWINCKVESVFNDKVKVYQHSWIVYPGLQPCGQNL